MLFAPIRFHDTINRGRLLNRFGKDFEGIDSNLSDNFGRRYAASIQCGKFTMLKLKVSIFNFAAVVTTIFTVTFVGGWPFFVAFLLLSIFYFGRFTSQWETDSH